MLSAHQRQPLGEIRRLDQMINKADLPVAIDVRGGFLFDTMDMGHITKEVAPISGSGSDYSDISALEDDTDEFGRKLFQQYRQQRRVEQNSDGRPQAFRKANRGPTLSERLGRTLPGNTQVAASANVTANDHARTASSGSTRSDPPLNVPQEWGRRERRESEWLRSRRAGGEEESVRAANQLGAFGPVQKNNAFLSTRSSRLTDMTPELDHRDEALASVENTPPSMRRHRLEETPYSLRHMNTTIQQAIEMDDQDFTAFSLLASTPPVNNRHRKIDEIAREEVRSFQRRGPLTRMRIQEVETELPLQTRAQTSPSIEPKPLPSRRRNIIPNEENLPLDPGTLGPSKEPTSLANRTTHAVTFKNTQRYQHQRGDSYNLLRQLARISSPSPSPAGDKTGPETAGNQPKRQPTSQSPLQFKTELLSEKPLQGLLNGGPAVELPEMDATPAPKAKHEDSKTPVVTGAWVNTPVTEKSNRRLQSVLSQGGKEGSTKLTSESSRSHIKAAHATSALADTISQPKNRSAVTSRESRVRTVGSAVDADAELVDGLTQADREQRQEQLAIEAMNKHMQAARTSIKNANRGLRRVEREMEHSQAGMDSVYDLAQETDKPAVNDFSLVVKNRNTTKCTHCGCNGSGHRSVWGALWSEFRGCFYSWDRTSPYWVRFTWLGVLCVLWATWYLTENILCHNFCKPEYAENLEDYDITYDMPAYPFVIPTLLFRPFKWLWEPVFEYLAWCFGVWAQAWIGDDAVSPEPVVIKPAYGAGMKRAFTNTYTAAAETVATAIYSTRMVQSVVDAVDEVGRMWDDEFL